MLCLCHYGPALLRFWFQTDLGSENSSSFLKVQAPVVQTSDSAIHRIILYPVDSAIGFPNTYPLDSDLSGG